MAKRRLASFGALLVGLWSACAQSAAVPDPPPGAEATTPPPATGPLPPPQILCYRGPQLVLASIDGRNVRPLPTQPPELFNGLAVADKLIVGAGEGTVYTLREGKFVPIGSFGDQQVTPLPVRVGSYDHAAVVWLRGQDSGTVPAALSVTPDGKVERLPIDAAKARFGEIFQTSNRPSRSVDKTFPEALRLFLREERMNGRQIDGEKLLFVEPSGWGGRLVGPSAGLGKGDWPDAPLFWLTSRSGDKDGKPSKDETARPLLYREQPLSHRGVIGYGPTGELVFDGRFAADGGGLLSVPAPRGASSARATGILGIGPSIDAQRVGTLEPPCTLLPADFRETDLVGLPAVKPASDEAPPAQPANAKTPQRSGSVGGHESGSKSPRPGRARPLAVPH